MIAIEAGQLRPGRVLSKGLYTRDGRKLLGPGAVLTEEVCRAVGAGGKDLLYLASSAGEVSSHFRQRSGERARQPTGRAAPAPGAVPRARDEDPCELPGLSSEAISEARRWARGRSDELIRSGASRWLRPDARPPLTPARPRAVWREGVGWFDADELRAFFAERAGMVRGWLTRVVSRAGEAGGDGLTIEEPLEWVIELGRLAGRYPRRCAQLALAVERTEDDPAEQMYAACVLGVLMACRAGWPASLVSEAGLASLLCDAGMVLVPRALRRLRRSLDDTEINGVRRHPSWSLALASTLAGVPDGVLAGVLQHHERLDGSGYPLGLRGAAVHDLARLAGVANDYAASVSPRAYKPRARAFTALGGLIGLGAAKKIDRRAVALLADAVGLFPVGSRVRLSSGVPASVVGSTPGRPDRPLVRVMMEGEDGTERFRTGGGLIDLADPSRAGLRVEKPVEDG
ncbi:MAG: hypothetical protein JNM07_10095 [Phycisphaerae bacterium]|nr:hypothetical protein [Phycisphaerae bacterium]